MRTSLPLVTALAARAAADSCDQVHLFLARGNNEPYPGRQGLIVEALCSGLASCGYEDIQFSARVDDVYCESTHQGAVNGLAQLVAYNARCPRSKLVLSGYSEGAMILGDMLGGGGGNIWGKCTQQPNDALDADGQVAKQIIGVLLFGDVRHTAGQPYNYLSGSDISSAVPRTPDMLARLARYAGVTRSYCDVADPICAGGKDVTVHWAYLQQYSTSATAWIKEKAGLSSGGPQSLPPPSSPPVAAPAPPAPRPSVQPSPDVNSTSTSLVPFPASPTSAAGRAPEATPAPSPNSSPSPSAPSDSSGAGMRPTFVLSCAMLCFTSAFVFLAYLD